jgi:protein-S-isoprenylcysteine O-methyltransferase Ste14
VVHKSGRGWFMAGEQNDKKKQFSYRRLMIRSFISIIGIGVAIFALAGRLDYWQGWVYFVTSFILFLVFAVSFANKQDLIKERVRPGPGVKWWDKFFFALYVPLSISVGLLAALDAGRLHWSPELPVIVYPLMWILTVTGYGIIYWAMWTNQFFSSRVRIQTDRGHYVITTGPYRFVRHPGYTGAIIIISASTVLLGSLYALIPAGITIILLIVRTELEDITLQKELPGYADYAQKIRYRLIPYIW